MFIVGLFFIFFFFLKFLFYGIYEIKTLNNKVGGITICTLAVISSIFTSSIIIYFYIL